MPASEQSKQALEKVAIIRGWQTLISDGGKRKGLIYQPFLIGEVFSFGAIPKTTRDKILPFARPSLQTSISANMLMILRAPGPKA